MFGFLAFHPETLVAAVLLNESLVDLLVQDCRVWVYIPIDVLEILLGEILHLLLVSVFALTQILDQLLVV